MHSLKPVKKKSDIETIARLAHEIWNEHFVDIIGQSQVDYMLGHFQSVPAITSQLETGQEYYLLESDGVPLGYLSLIADKASKKVMISKIYLLRNARGLGLGQYLLDFVKLRCKKNKFKVIWLTVNRNNHTSIDWYQKRGFTITGEIQKDIGEGYFMDDYVMEVNPGCMTK